MANTKSIKGAPTRSDFAGLRRKPGPKPTWLAAAAADLGYSKPHLSAINSGARKSPAAEAALKAWKTANPQLIKSA